MAGEKKSVASLTLLADQPKQALNDLVAAEQRFNAEGGKLATSIATGFQTIEDRAKKALTTIANGGNAEAQLNRLVAEYSKLKTAQDAAVESGQKLPEEFNQAFSVAEKQISAVSGAMQAQRSELAGLKAQFTEAGSAALELANNERQVTTATADVDKAAAAGAASVDKMMAALRQPGAQQTLEAEQKALLDVRAALEKDVASFKEFGTEGSRAVALTERKIEEVDRALAKLGDEQKSFDKLTNNFRVTEKVFDQFEQKVAEGGPITARAVAPVIQNFERLKEKMRETADVTPEMTARFAQLETRLKAIDAETRKSIDSMADHKVVLAEGGVQWTGFGNTLGIAAGQYGKVLSAAGAVAGAIYAGVQAGIAFDHFTKTDMSAAASMWEDLRNHAHNYMQELFSFDNAGSKIHNMTAALRLDADAFRGLQAMEAAAGQELENYTDKRRQLADVGRVDNAVLGTGAEIQREWSRLKREAGTNVDLLAASTTRMNTVIDIHNKLVAFGIDGERVWKQLHFDHATTVQQLTERLHALGIDLKFLSDGVDHFNAAEKSAIETEKAFIASQEALKAKLAEVAKMIGTEEDALHHLFDAINDQVSIAEKHEVAQNGTTKSIQNVATNLHTLTKAYDENAAVIGEQIGELDKVTKAGVALSEETKRHAAVIVDTNAKIQELETTNRSLAAELTSSAKAFDQLTRTEIQDREEKQRQIDANKGLIESGRARIAAEAAQLGQTQATTAEGAKATEGTQKWTLANGEAIDAHTRLGKAVGDAGAVTKDAASSLSEYAEHTHISAAKAEELADGSRKAAVAVGDAAAPITTAGAALNEMAGNAELSANKVTMIGGAHEAVQSKGGAFLKFIKDLNGQFANTSDIDVHIGKMHDLVNVYDLAAIAGERLTGVQKIIQSGGATETGTPVALSPATVRTPPEQHSMQGGGRMQ